ncbi:protein of unknown function [Streptomyces murinus]
MAAVSGRGCTHVPAAGGHLLAFRHERGGSVTPAAATRLTSGRTPQLLPASPDDSWAHTIGQTPLPV